MCSFFFLHLVWFWVSHMQGRFINVPILKLFLCRFSSYDSNLPLLALRFIVSYCFFFFFLTFLFYFCSMSLPVVARTWQSVPGKYGRSKRCWQENHGHSFRPYRGWRLSFKVTALDNLLRNVLLTCDVAVRQPITSWSLVWRTALCF